MVWRGRHDTILGEDGMTEQCVAAYTFSKSYSMSGWRLGYAVAHPRVAAMIGTMINTTLSCTPPFVQLAGLAALEHDAADRVGVACLGGECFGAAGAGFLRFSCAEPDDRLAAAVAFLREAVTRTDRVRRYLETNPQY